MLVATVLTVTSGCTGDSSPPLPAPTISVVQGDPVTEAPIDFVVRGLTAGTRVEIELTSKDAVGVAWRSRASYRADRSGAVDTASTAAISGSYRGVVGAGLLWSLSPHPSGGSYVWNDTGADTFTVTATATGRATAHATFRRTLTTTKVDLAQSHLVDGFVGRFYTPDVIGDSPRPSVLVIGGSEGGLPSPILPTLLAAHGYPTLAVAYFGYPGLPTKLENIPISYFSRAVRWLERRPETARRVVVIGISRGSEAAEQLAALDPRDVRGLITAVPSSVRVCSFPDCEGAAWTWQGRPLPYTRQFNEPHPTDDRSAVIPVEHAAGPVLAICAGDDRVWSSCPYATALATRLRKHGYAWSVHVLRYPTAGHAIGALVPNEPTDDSGSVIADQRAQAQLWPRVLDFLRRAAAEG